MTSRTHLANEAWEALFRAQATVAAELTAADVWDEVRPSEYGVLLALSRSPDGLRVTQLLDDVLLTQGGVSKLCARLEAAGLVERLEDPDDRRASRLRLTAAGAEVQRRIGRRHGHHVASVMAGALDVAQLEQLRELCGLLVGAAAPTAEPA